MSRTGQLDRSAHRVLRRWLPWGFGAYLLVGFLAAPTEKHEIFPFFCWFLFPLTPAEQSRFQVRLEVNAGLVLPSLPPFEAAGHIVASRSVDAQFVIERLGRAVTDGRERDVAQSRALFESHFLRPPCRYSLWRRRYDPLLSFAGAPDLESMRVADFNCDSVSHVSRSQ